MSEKTGLFYEFAGFRLDVAQRTLTRSGEPLALTPKVFETLLFLVQNSGRVLEKDELMKTLWPDSFVEEGNLSQNISILRKTLGDDRNGNGLIQTIPRRGYKFVAAVKQIDSDSSQSSLAADYWNCHSPFRSLQVFEPEDAWLFFGRDREISELLERLACSPVLAVVGNSGCGKSSLIRAGLIPALQAGRFSYEGRPVESWRIAIFRPSGSPFDYLAEVLPSQLAPELSLTSHTELVADCRRKFPLDQEALRNAIIALANGATERSNEKKTHVLLVADQFEELFTLTTERQVRDRYVGSLLAASNLGGAVFVHVVLALRADFYAQCLEHPELSRRLAMNQYNVPRMNREQLRECIERRLQLASSSAESGLIDTLLEEVGDEPGNLALLEHALGQLWDKSGGFGRTLTNRAYSDIGRLRGALGRHADDVYAGLGSDRLKLLARKIFLELVHLGEDGDTPNSSDTRRRVAKTDLLALGEEEEVEQMLARLASSRLISTGGSEEEPFVEVSHEALIREWPALREWITTHRDSLRLERRLRQAAEEWERVKRDPGALLQGARLAQGEEWLVNSSESLPIVREFLQASMESRDEAARRKLVRSRWFSFALGTLLLATIGVAWYVYRLQLVEKSRALAAQAEELRGQDQGQALNLAIRAWRTAKTDEARLAVTKAFPQLVATLNHAAGVESALFSPDGQRVLTASDDHTARLWSSKDGRLLATLEGHKDRIIYAEFSSDGKRIVTASFDHTARIWDGVHGALLAILEGHTDKLMRAQFSLDGMRIVTASLDHTARVWSTADGHSLAVLQAHGNSVSKAVFSPDGRLIVTAGWDNIAHIWSGTDYGLVTDLAGHDNAIVDVEFSPDGQRIVTSSSDLTARIWNSVDGHLLATLRHDSTVVRARFSPDGLRIATASLDHAVRIWDGIHGRLLVTLNGHTAGVRHVTFSRDGRLVLTDSDDSTARVWSSVTGRLLAVMTIPVGSAASPVDLSVFPYFSTFSPDGHLVVTALGDPAARIWNIAASGETTAILRGHTGDIREPVFSPDGQRIFTTSTDNTTRIWNSSDGHLLRTLQGRSDFVYRSILSPDGQRVVTKTQNTAQIWNVTDGGLLATLKGHTDLILGAQFSPDGKRIVTASRDRTIRTWNSADGYLLIAIPTNGDSFGNVVFSRDGQSIATSTSDGIGQVWNAADGRSVTIFRGKTGNVYRPKFSHDSRRILAGCTDQTAKIWDANTGRLLATLRGHAGEIHSVEFSPDDQLIATASADNTARIWNGSDNRLLIVLEGHTDGIWDAQFSPDGLRIATASLDHTARIWDSVNGSMIAVLQGHTYLVSDAIFSPNGQRIATASYDQTARIWRVITLDDLQRILAE